MEEKEFAQAVYDRGGNVYIAGGWVRDRMRGVEARDKDYVVTGMEENAFRGAFPRASKVGKAFPVYLLEIGGKMCEVAFARKERKAGSGYRGFVVACDPTVTIEEDLYRRDTTMNSIAYCLRTKSYIDPYHGIADIKARRIRATSRHFLEDPIRALRAARQAAQIGYRIEPATNELMKACKEELAMEPGERMVSELTKALQTDRPSVFFRCLAEAELLAVTYPQLFALIGKPKPKPDDFASDAFGYALRTLDAAAEESERVEVRFAALAYGLGVGAAPSAREWRDDCTRYGLDALAAFDRRMTLPKLWLSCARIVIEEHGRVNSMAELGEIVDLLVRIEKNPIGFDGFNAVTRALCGQLPDFLAEYRLYLEAIHQVRGSAAPEGLGGKAIGDWIRNQRVLACQTVMHRNKIESPS